MPITRLSTAARNAAAKAIGDLIDADAGAGTLKLYTGTVPANGDTEPTGTLLATVPFSVASYTGPVNGTITFVDPAPIVASAAGAAGCYIVEDASGDNVFSGDVTATGGGGSLELATVSLSSGLTVDISSLTYTQPAG